MAAEANEKKAGRFRLAKITDVLSNGSNTFNEVNIEPSSIIITYLWPRYIELRKRGYNYKVQKPKVMKKMLKSY